MSGPKPDMSRLGQTNTMKNGKEATIIAYRSSASIDVRFSDGVIVENRPYASFQKGLIGHPNELHKSKIKNRVGESNRMSNGMVAEIIRYETAQDIDVRFEDNTVRTGCAYKEFRSGNIAHPLHTSAAMAGARLGEKNKMKCGLIATIIRYSQYNDMDVLFENGEKVEHVDYGCFKEGVIIPPFIKDGCRSLQESAVYFYISKLGFCKTRRGSLKDIGLGEKELDFYHPEKKIAIEIDGIFHKKESDISRDIEKNRICHEAGIKIYRLRDKALPTLEDGLSVNYLLEGEKIYNGLVDCKKELENILELNEIVIPYIEFINFQRDLVQILDFHYRNTVNYKGNKKIGETIFHKTTNQMMTIIDYRDYLHVDIQFDDGAIAYNKNYGAFKKGEIKHPSQTSAAKKEARIGEEKVMNSGDIARIIAYRNAEDIDVQFENGEIVRGVTYHNYSRGNIRNPIYIPK